MNPLVVPDTGIFLAHGYGEEVDTMAGAAINALDLAGESTEIYLVSSVEDELEGKLTAMADAIEVIPEMRKAADDLPEGDVLRLIEMVTVKMRQRQDNLTRFHDAVARRLVGMSEEWPDQDWHSYFALILGEALLVQERIQTRIDAINITRFACGNLRKGSGGRRLAKGIGRADGDHLQCCQKLAEVEDQDVLFLVLESRLLSHKGSIEKMFPRVKVTIPPFLKTYLD